MPMTMPAPCALRTLIKETVDGRKGFSDINKMHCNFPRLLIMFFSYLPNVLRLLIIKDTYTDN